MTTSPFSFQNLPQVSRTENDLVVALQSLWQRMGFAQQLVPNLEQVIAKNVGLAAKLTVDRIFTTPAKPESGKPESGKDFLATLPPAGAYVLLGLTPVSEKAIVEVDLQLAHVIIDRLLGGTGEPLGVIGPLSEVEEGVLSYFVLKLLAQIHEQAGGGTRLHFRLEEMAHSVKSWQAKVSDASVVIFLTLSLGHRSGYLKLILPANLIQKGFLEAFSGVPVPDPPPIRNPICPTLPIVMVLCRLSYAWRSATPNSRAKILPDSPREM